jgi:hypothetical protein
MKRLITACVASVLAFCVAAPTAADEIKDFPKITWGKTGEHAFPTIEKTSTGTATIRASGGFELPKDWSLDDLTITLRVSDLQTNKIVIEKGKADQRTGPTAWGPIEVAGLDPTHRFQVSAEASFKDPDGKARVFASKSVTLPGPDAPHKKTK